MPARAVLYSRDLPGGGYVAIDVQRADGLTADPAAHPPPQRPPRPPIRRITKRGCGWNAGPIRRGAPGTRRRSSPRARGPTWSMRWPNCAPSPPTTCRSRRPCAVGTEGRPGLTGRLGARSHERPPATAGGRGGRGRAGRGEAGGRAGPGRARSLSRNGGRARRGGASWARSGRAGPGRPRPSLRHTSVGSTMRAAWSERRKLALCSRGRAELVELLSWLSVKVGGSSLKATGACPTRDLTTLRRRRSWRAGGGHRRQRAERVELRAARPRSAARCRRGRGPT
jgi:hypothetical protein